MKNNFFPSKDSNKTRTMYTNSDNTNFLIGNETEKIIQDFCESLLERYHKGLKESLKESEFVFDGVGLLHYKLNNKISLNRGRSQIDPPKQLKNKKAIINPKTNDEKCFQYAITTALNYEQIKSHPERMTKIIPFIDQ